MIKDNVSLSTLTALQLRENPRLQDLKLALPPRVR